MLENVREVLRLSLVVGLYYLGETYLPSAPGGLPLLASEVGLIIGTSLIAVIVDQGLLRRPVVHVLISRSKRGPDAGPHLVLGPRARTSGEVLDVALELERGRSLLARLTLAACRRRTVHLDVRVAPANLMLITPEEPRGLIVTPQNAVRHQLDTALEEGLVGASRLRITGRPTLPINRRASVRTEIGVSGRRGRVLARLLIARADVRSLEVG